MQGQIRKFKTASKNKPPVQFSIQVNGETKQVKQIDADRPKRVIMIEGKEVDLSSEVYDQAENESDEAYIERMMDEVWAYLQSPVAQKVWEQKQGVVGCVILLMQYESFLKTY